jgi:hypothetical protein
VRHSCLGALTQLVPIYSHGSTYKLHCVTMESGSLAVMAVFETDWRPNMEVMICPFCDCDDADRVSGR